MSLSPNFPFGKSVWIWQLWTCAGKKDIGQVTSDDLKKIAQKLVDHDIQIALVKAGDGTNTWEQWTPELIKIFHDAGLKIFSWSYVYGKDPNREAAIAMWALDMGADGHVFDAESEYKTLPNPGMAATTMLKAVRAHAPQALLGHSPMPIIDYHQSFPYVEFGRYCDFVMPQVYYGEWGKTATQGVSWVYDQWAKWEKHWQDAGFGDSVKPLIFVHQTYDWVSTLPGTPDYVVTPASIFEFVKDVEGYKAVSFYEYAHILRDDCWQAIRDAKVLPPSADEQLTSAPNPSASTPTVTVTVNAPNVQTPTGVPSQPTPPQPPVTAQPASDATQPASSQPVPPQGQNPIDPLSTPPVDSSTATPSATPVSPTMPMPQKIDLPATGRTTITVKTKQDDPTTIDVRVVNHVPHAIIVRDFLLLVFHGVSTLFSRKNKQEVSK